MTYSITMRDALIILGVAILLTVDPVSMFVMGETYTTVESSLLLIFMTLLFAGGSSGQGDDES